MNVLYNCVEVCLFVNTSPLTTRRFGLTLTGNQTLSWMRTIASPASTGAKDVAVRRNQTLERQT